MGTHSSILAWEIPMDRGAWGSTAHGVAKSQTQLSDKAQHIILYTNIYSMGRPKHIYVHIYHMIYLYIVYIIPETYIQHITLLYT